MEINWKNLLQGVYYEPGVWNIPIMSVILHVLLGVFVWNGMLAWWIALLMFLFLHEVRLVFATPKARKLLQAQHYAYMQAQTQELIESGMLKTPEGGEYL